MKKKTVQKPNKGKGKTITSRKASLKKPNIVITKWGKPQHGATHGTPAPTSPPPSAKPTVPDWFKRRQEAATAPEGYVTPPKPKLPPRPPAMTGDDFRPINTFAEGTIVDIKGVADMQKLTIERIGPGGVTVSGGRLSPNTVISGNSPAMLHYHRPATDKEPALRVSVPVGHGDFSSMPPGGTVTRTGGNNDGTDPVPAKERLKPRLPGATEADLPASFKKPAPKREGVCAFIDNLILEGGRTAEEVCELTLAQFPGRDPKATLSTVKTRPAHIKAKGQTPPPFKK